MGQSRLLHLKPVTRRVWAPIGERPNAPGHNRLDWLCVTAFVNFSILETFAREAEAGLSRIILLVRDNAGWPANLKIPDRLICLSPYSPELHPSPATPQSFA